MDSEQTSRTVTQHYVEVRGRRVHYRRVGMGPPVVLLHASPRSSAALLPLLESAPDGVTAFAFDTPGFGHSDPLPRSEPDADAFGIALMETFDALGIRSAAVYGTHTGAAIGLACAERFPERVNRLVIDGLGVFDAGERAAILAHYLPEFLPRADGSHLAWLWSRIRDQFLFFPWNDCGAGARLWRPLPSAEFMHQVAMDFLAAGDHYRAAYAAAFRMDSAAALSRLTVRCVVGARADDMLLPHLERLGRLPPNVAVTQFPTDAAQWKHAIWQDLGAGKASSVAAVHSLTPHIGQSREAALSDARASNAYLHLRTGRLHMRGSLSGKGRPLVLLHDSPGGGRGMQAALDAYVGVRPVIAFDLPGHGDSSVGDPSQPPLDATLTMLHEGLQQLGWNAAEISGEGCGAWLARALSTRYSLLYDCAEASLAVAAQIDAYRMELTAPESVSVCAAGGHLAKRWYEARDTLILGSWTQRPAIPRYPCGDSVSTELAHLRTLDGLKDTAFAASLRAAILSH